MRSRKTDPVGMNSMDIYVILFTQEFYNQQKGATSSAANGGDKEFFPAVPFYKTPSPPTSYCGQFRPSKNGRTAFSSILFETRIQPYSRKLPKICFWPMASSVRFKIGAALKIAAIFFRDGMKCEYGSWQRRKGVLISALYLQLYYVNVTPKRRDMRNVNGGKIY